MSSTNDPHPQHSLLQQIEYNEITNLEIIKEVEDVFVVVTNDSSSTDTDTGTGRSTTTVQLQVRFDDIRALLTALIRNNSITSIVFEGDFLDCLRADKRSELLQTLGSYLPALTELCLGDTPMHVRDVSHIVTHASGTLTKLTLHDLILQGTVEEFRAFERALLWTTKKTSSIQEFRMKECTTSVLSGSSSSSSSTIDLNRIGTAWKSQKEASSFAAPRTIPVPTDATMLIARKRLSIVPRTA